MNIIHLKKLIFLMLVLVCLRSMGQVDAIKSKPSGIDLIQLDHQNAAKQSDGKSNFDHWIYSEKKHAIVGYLGTIYQYGVNGKTSANTWHYDLGAIYRGNMVQSTGYTLNLHAWVEHANLVAGKSTKDFAKQLEMFSLSNANTSTESSLRLEYLYIENLFFDGKWDVSIGKIDQLFATLLTSYAGWDKLVYFGKTPTSNPVPPIDPAFGFFTKFNLTKNFSFGGMITDSKDVDGVDAQAFFNSSAYYYQGFIKWYLFPSKGLHSEHAATYYEIEPDGENKRAEGIAYVGNQGLTENLILTLKASKGWGRTDAYDGAYMAGLILLDAFDWKGDQLGGSIVVNEKQGTYEYGIDAYYKLFFKPWISASVNIQAIQNSNNRLNFIPGIRTMLTY